MRVSADPIVNLPFDSELANLHLRLSGDDDMQLLAHQVYLKGAVEWAEGQTHRAFSLRAHQAVLNRFPPGAIMLPRGRCSAVESIVYWEDATTPVTLSGPTSTVPGADWQEDLSSDAGAILLPPPGETWPTADPEVVRPVEITFTAGYQTAPEDAQVAMFMYAADRYDIATQNDVADHSTSVAVLLLLPFQLVRYS